MEGQDIAFAVDGHRGSDLNRPGSTNPFRKNLRGDGLLLAYEVLLKGLRAAFKLHPNLQEFGCLCLKFRPKVPEGVAHLLAKDDGFAGAVRPIISAEEDGFPTVPLASKSGVWSLGFGV